MEPPVSRRTVLQAVTLFTAGAGGCLSGNDDGTNSTRPPVDSTDEPNTTASPCAARPGESASGSSCAGVTITHVAASPRTTTETRTETTPPGDRGEEVVVRVESDGDAQHRLVGCIEGGDGIVEVSESVPAEAGTHEFRIGTFDHHGVRNVLVWIQGCRDHTA